MDAKTQKSELTRAAIVGAGIDVAAEQGLEAITLQAVADRIGISKSGVFSRIGSREALQKAVIEEFGRRFLADVFVPAMQLPKGLPRLDEIVRRWIAALRRTVQQAVEMGHLMADTDPQQLVSEISALALGLIHDVRFLRDSRAADRAQASWSRLLKSYQT
jgi:AcrR family transcriptional regulator